MLLNSRLPRPAAAYTLEVCMLRISVTFCGKCNSSLLKLQHRRYYDCCVMDKQEQI